MVFAAELVAADRPLCDEAADRHRASSTSLALPTTYPRGRWQTLLATMQRDKKARGGMLRFIVLDDLGKPDGADRPGRVAALRRVPGDRRVDRTRRARWVTLMTPRARPQRPEPRPARQPGARMSTARQDLEPICAAAPRLTELEVDDRAATDRRRGRAARLAARGGGRRRSGHPEPGGVHALLATRFGMPSRWSRSAAAPSIEVHISIRTPARSSGTRASISGVATGVIAGFGLESYVLALHAIARAAKQPK